MTLEGKVTLVTGAARERGIGRGIALCLAERGCDVVVNDVAAEAEGEELAGRIRGLGPRATFLPADVSDRAAVEQMVAEVVKEYGRLDIVCSNAGVAGWETLSDVTPESLRRQVSVNLTGAFNVCQTAARAIVARGDGGRIVITSSVHVQMPFAAMAVYGATKQGLRVLTEHMAIELAPHGITANHVGPGWVRSFINDASPVAPDGRGRRDDARADSGRTPGRAGGDRRRGRLLASDEAAYVTGAFLRVDGGFVVGKY